MHPGQARRLRHEKAQRERTLIWVRRNGRVIGQVRPVEKGRAALTLPGGDYRGTYPTVLRAELRAVAIAKEREALTA